MKNIFFRKASALFNWFLPASCVLCRNKTYQIRDICNPCFHELPFTQTACFRCGISLEPCEDPKNLICGSCLAAPPHYHSTLALCQYESPVDKLIAGLKFQKQLKYARLLSELLISHLLEKNYQQNTLPEVIIPIPLHKKRLSERGYNQALELAKPIAKYFKLRVETKNCLRVRSTVAQTLVPVSERKKNLSNAFEIKKTFSAKHVAIIDDVVTTGHTVNEFSKALMKSGVERIDVWCIARTNAHRNQPSPLK